jgi:hypothetical protein
MTISDGDLREMYRRMSSIRQFEERKKDLLLKDEPYGAVPHLDRPGSAHRRVMHGVAYRRSHVRHTSIARTSDRQGSQARSPAGRADGVGVKFTNTEQLGSK